LIDKPVMTKEKLNVIRKTPLFYYLGKKDEYLDYKVADEIFKPIKEMYGVDFN